MDMVSIQSETVLVLQVTGYCPEVVFYCEGTFAESQLADSFILSLRLWLVWLAVLTIMAFIILHVLSFREVIKIIGLNCIESHVVSQVEQEGTSAALSNLILVSLFTVWIVAVDVSAQPFDPPIGRKAAEYDRPISNFYLKDEHVCHVFVLIQLFVKVFFIFFLDILIVRFLHLEEIDDFVDRWEMLLAAHSRLLGLTL